MDEKHERKDGKIIERDIEKEMSPKILAKFYLL